MSCIIKESISNSPFLKSIKEARLLKGDSIQCFDFKKSRCRILSKSKELNIGGVLYWMCRDCRIQDNWAMLYAQRLALKNKVPMFVCYFIKDMNWLHPTRRHLKFLIDGLKDVAKEASDLNIPFYLVNDTPLHILELVKSKNIGCIVSEFFPLKQHREYQQKILDNLPKDIAMVEVDAHNIVPAWLASDKQEIAARTIRPKILKQLPEFMTGFPLVCQHPHIAKLKINHLIEDYDLFVDNSEFPIKVDEVEWIKGGQDNAFEMLRTFLSDRLKYYGIRSNDPTKNAVSNLSPWIHFGQISAERIAIEVKSRKTTYSERQCDNFLEELIIRKELSDNFCYYNKNYDNFEGADLWAKKTLDEHRKDKRLYLYRKDQFEQAKTHDEIWNAAQIQLNVEGKIHGYMRMYWCKKILEWTKSPEEAVEIALYLNDTYSLDGNDPNGFVGVMWSICGVHDHGWKEREIFGKIRFMVDYCLRNKIDAESYCAQHGCKLPPSNKKSSSQKGIKKRKI